MAKVKHYIHPDKVIREIKHGDGTVEYEHLTKEEWEKYDSQRNGFAGCMTLITIIVIIFIFANL